MEEKTPHKEEKLKIWRVLQTVPNWLPIVLQIYHSEAIRTKETGELIVKELKNIMGEGAIDPNFTETKALGIWEYGDKEYGLDDFMKNTLDKSNENNEIVMVISHQPILNKISDRYWSDLFGITPGKFRVK